MMAGAALAAVPVYADSDVRVAMVTDYGDITDQSFNQTTYEAAKAFCEANGVDFTYYKPEGDSTAERVAMIDKASKTATMSSLCRVMHSRSYRRNRRNVSGCQVRRTGCFRSMTLTPQRRRRLCS